MNFDVAVVLWGTLATTIVIAGIVTGEWKEKLSYTRTDSHGEGAQQGVRCTS